VKSKRWQRSTTVGSTFAASVVASTKTVFGGGSSSVLRNAFQAALDSMCASSRM
jgi:formiminotetrahydrofolate cyclodeaminase